MKKFYTTILAALCVVGASAAEGRVKPVLEFKVPATFTVSEYSSMINNVQLKPMADVSEIKSVDDLVGEWTWTAFNFLGRTEADQNLSQTITISKTSETEIAINGMCPFAIAATVNVANGTLSIANNQKIGADNDGDVIFYVKAINAEGTDFVAGATTDAAAVGTIEGTTVSFPQMEVWAVGDPAKEDLGFYILTAQNTLALVGGGSTGGEDEGVWTDYGIAEFTDGWLMVGLLGTSPVDNPWNVTVQRNTANRNLYRIHNPYMEDDFIGKSVVNGSEGDIVFDLSDPEFVSVRPGYNSGATVQGQALRCFNVEGYFLTKGATKQQIIAELGATYPQWSTFNNYVLTVPTCRFNFPSAPDKLYTWSDDNNQTLADVMVTTLKFDAASIGDVEIDTDANAPVEYFNLQGMKIETPAAGQIVIRRQGSKVEKQFVK